jgi:hypothetical protein
LAIIIEAVHTIKPLTDSVFDRWVEAYAEVSIPAMERNGFDVLGWFKRSGGRMGQDLILARFENLAEFEKASASLYNDAELAKWIPLALEEFEVEESVIIGAQVPYATEQRLEKALAAKPEKPRQYMQAVLEVGLGDQAAAHELLGKLADTIDSGAGGLVTAYQATSGPRERLTDIWAFDSMPDLSYQPGDPLGELVAPLREVAPEESIYYLNPLPGSPLQ